MNSAFARQQRAFLVYCDQGPNRSLGRLAFDLRDDPGKFGFKHAPTLRTLENWSVWYDWQSRLEAIEQMEAIAAEQEYRDKVAEHRDEAWNRAEELEQLAWKRLREMRDDKMSVIEAIRLLELARQWKEQALGLGGQSAKGGAAAVFTPELVTDLMRTRRQRNGSAPIPDVLSM